MLPRPLKGDCRPAIGIEQQHREPRVGVRAARGVPEAAAPCGACCDAASEPSECRAGSAGGTAPGPEATSASAS